MTWTQPQCGPCFEEANGRPAPHRMRDPASEVCCTCGATTCEGIYTRVDPATVPFPREDP